MLAFGLSQALKGAAPGVAVRNAGLANIQPIPSQLIRLMVRQHARASSTLFSRRCGASLSFVRSNCYNAYSGAHGTDWTAMRSQPHADYTKRSRFHTESNFKSKVNSGKLVWMSTSALLFAGIEDDEDPRGKTRTEKMLELSRRTLDEELENRRNAMNPVKRWLVKYIWEPFLTWVRFLTLVGLFSPVLLTGLVVAIRWTPLSWRMVWYKYLVTTLQTAGPSFIKLGQWAASRADIFPTELCTELSKLHSNAKSHSMAHTRRIVSESFGKPFEECFDSFDEKPLGVGAMAQVYRAVYKSNEYTGEVAVKVLHPNVEKLITRDLSIMSTLAQIINVIPTMEWLSLPGEVETFGRMMQSQLDLRLEADHLEVFNRKFAEDKDISFPKAPLQISSRQLLVEQMVHGVSMEKILKYSKHNEFDKAVAALGLDAFLKMLLLHNFIHADLHAGNIFLSLDHGGDTLQKLQSASNQEEWDSVWNTLDARTTAPHLWFIDAGLVTELNPANRANFLDLFKAIAVFDGYKAGELMVERSRTPETVIDREVFALKTERLVNQVKKRTFALGSVSINDLLSNMMEMVRKHHVRMESDFVTVVISILLLEGIGRSLDPDLDIFKRALPVLRKVGQQRATHIPQEKLSKDDILQMLKVWLVLETRQFITASVQDSYRCIKYDRLSPNN